jgi:hypothetical protein
MFDTIVKGGRVVDGSGLPLRIADVGIKDGIVTDVGHLDGAKRVHRRRRADGDPRHRRRAHPLRSAAVVRAVRTSSCFHGVTRWSPATAATRSRPAVPRIIRI